jgi:hypothetical protein
VQPANDLLVWLADEAERERNQTAPSVLATRLDTTPGTPLNRFERPPLTGRGRFRLRTTPAPIPPGEIERAAQGLEEKGLITLYPSFDSGDLPRAGLTQDGWAEVCRIRAARSTGRPVAEH